MRKLSMCLFLFATFVGTQNLEAQKLKGLKDKLNKAFSPKPVKGFYQLSKVPTGYDFTQLSDLTIEGDILAVWQYQQGQSINTEKFKKDGSMAFTKGMSGSFSGSRRPMSWYAIKTADSTFFIIGNEEKRPDTWNYERDKDFLCVISNNEAMLKALKDKTENADLKKNEEELVAVLKGIEGGWAAHQNAEKAKEQAAVDAKVLYEPSSFSPFTGAEVVKMYEAYLAKQKITDLQCVYAYSAPQQGRAQNTWLNSYDKKVINGVKKEIIPSRYVNYTIIMKKMPNTETNKTNQVVYVARDVWVENPAAAGVYDGSKYTSEYRIAGMGNYLGEYTEKAALKYKDVKGGTSKK